MKKFEPIKPPIKGFDIFAPNEPANLNACINFMQDMNYGYVEGYRHAAELLYDKVAEEGGEIDSLIYPIMFMLRQHFELRLKRILNLLYKINGVPKEPQLIHDLKLLWQQASRLLCNYSTKEDQGWFESISELFKQFTDEDPKADAFRFPLLRNKSKSLEGVSHINLYQLFSVVVPVMDWLEGIENFLENLSLSPHSND